MRYNFTFKFIIKYILKNLHCEIKDELKNIKNLKKSLTIFCLLEISCTVVHVTNRVGTMSVPGGASYMWCMSKDFLGFKNIEPKGNIGGNTIINH